MRWIGFNSKEQFPIGLDIGFDSVKMLQLESQGDGLAIRAAVRQSVPLEAQTTPAQRITLAMPLIKEVMLRGQFRGRRMVVTLPREYVQAKTLRLPLMPEQEQQAAIAFECKSLFPTDSDKLHIRHILAGEVRQGHDTRSEVIVLAVEKKKVDDLLELFNQADLVVDSLDFEPAAIYRGIERFLRRRDDVMDVNVMVDVGGRQSLVVIGRGHDIHFSKTIDVGGRHLNEAVSRKLQLSYDEARSLRRRFGTQAWLGEEIAPTDPVRQAVVDATRNHMSDLARELSMCLRYYSVTFRGQRPSKVRVGGGEAADPILLSMLSQQLNLPTEVYRPLAGIDLTRMGEQDRFGPMSEWAVALGAAVRRLPNDTLVRRVSTPTETQTRRRTDQRRAEVVDVARAVGGNTTDRIPLEDNHA